MYVDIVLDSLIFLEHADGWMYSQRNYSGKYAFIEIDEMEL